MAHTLKADGHLGYLPPQLEHAPKDFFIFGVEFLPLAASAVRQEARFETDEDSAFLIVAAARLYLSNADAIIANDEALALVQIKQLSSGQQLLRPTAPGQNDSPIDNFFGTGKTPMYWSVPVVIPPNDGMVVQLTNLEAVSRNYRLSFIGCKLYRAPAMDPYSYFRRGDW